jgi:hypothetical protein
MFEVFDDTTLQGVWRKSRVAREDREFPKAQFSGAWAAAGATDDLSDDLPTQTPGSDCDFSAACKCDGFSGHA